MIQGAKCTDIALKLSDVPICSEKDLIPIDVFWVLQLKNTRLRSLAAAQITIPRSLDGSTSRVSTIKPF